MLKIKIEGAEAAGKTALAAVVSKALADAGYKVHVDDEGLPSGNKTAKEMQDYAPDRNDGRPVLIKVRTR